MAPYAIAHVKIGLKLFETGYRFESNERARVYLTNALEPAGDEQLMFDFLPALAHEAKAVNEIKRQKRFTAIVGNPPYAKSSSNRSDMAKSLVSEYKRLVYGETNVQPLSDDYLKFVALAFKVAARHTAVVGLITNRSYLEGLIHRGMRFVLARDCSRIEVIDLHGDSNVGERPPGGAANENIFDIQQGVAISLFFRSLPRQAPVSLVLHRDLWGTRKEKYRALAVGEFHTGMGPLPLSEPYWFFAPKDLGTQHEQVSWASVDSLFHVNGMGVKSRRDHFLLDESKTSLRARMSKLARCRDVERLRDDLQVKDNPQWSLAAMRDLLEREGVDRRIFPIAYRPCDTRFIWYHREAIERGDARWPVMKHVLPQGLSLLTSRQSANHDFTSVFVARGLSEMKTAESTRGSYVFPARKRADVGRLQAGDEVSNIRRATFGPQLAKRKPEELVCYIYAILHSPEYRRRYAGALRIEFPRIPTSCAWSLADEICRLGWELIALHLMESHRLHGFITTYSGHRNPEVGRVGWSDGTAWLDAGKTNAREGQRATKPGTIGFRGVPEKVWDFHIGGYQVCHKWLKDRKGRTLSDEDIASYQKIVVALNETIRIMAEIDEVIEAHGGWPDAFQTGSEVDAASEATVNVVSFRPPTVKPAPEDRYVTCVPLVPLRAAASAFGDPQHIEDDDFEWVEVASRHRLRKGMFVAQVVGKSMEPTIPDAAWCLFRAPVEGTRQGKIVLVQLRDAIDPDTDQRYTVKRYQSEKAEAEDSWHHVKITLKPVNPDFEPIVLTGADDGELQVVAELVDVLRG